MPLHFTVLASGSAGNASLLETNGFGLLLDAGLGPRGLSQRLMAVGASWKQIHAVLLTHTHADHWKDKTLSQLYYRRIPLYCHAEHHQDLQAYGKAFAKLQAARLVRGYESGQELHLAPGLRCRPLPLRHDAGATFGFRFEAASDLFGEPIALGYAADLGSWNADLARELTDVDLLALEFNHDIALEYSSGRSPCLIERVVGEEGHLSNVQAGLLLQEVLRRSRPGRLQHVVQLHLSRECNHPGMAVEAARAVLVEPSWPVQLHTAWQDKPSATVVLGATVNGQNGIPQAAGRSTPDPLPSIQLTLPGMGDEDASEN